MLGHSGKNMYVVDVAGVVIKMYEESPTPFKPAREIGLSNLNSSVFIRSDFAADSAKELLELGFRYLKELKNIDRGEK
jgi:hypothetical protein